MAPVIAEPVTPSPGVDPKAAVAVQGRDNPNNVNYTVYDYLSVQSFTPLSNLNWYAADYVSGVSISDWTATLSVVFNVLGGDPSASITRDVQVQVTSYVNNCFRVRFNPDGAIEDYPNGPVVKPQLDYIRGVECGSPAHNPNFDTSDASNALVFETADLKVYINQNSAVVVTRKRDGLVVYQDDEIYGKSRGLMFVNRKYGTAMCSVRRNRKDDSDVDEAFYGAGEVVAENSSGDYFLERTGLAMTNYNYDNLNYAQPGVVPPEVSDGMPNYYIPMYYAAPWLVVQGYRGQPGMQYSYGWFLDNIGQTYMNTGDTQFNGEADKAYMGSAVGPFDQHFVYGAGDGIEPVVTAFSLLQGKEYMNTMLNKRAVMPPKYVFGFFQGVFGVRGLLPSNVECTPQNNWIVWKTIVDGYQDKNVPLEGLAIDVDVQDDLKVFTTRDTFWSAGKVGGPNDASNKSVFDWAHDRGLVTQTNITCFVRSDQQNYSVYEDMKNAQVYTKNQALDGGSFATNTEGPSDGYCGKLNYGSGDTCKAVFPDWGRSDTARWWGANYAKLFELGLDFVWQDMTVPAMAPHIRGHDVMEEPDWNYMNNVPRNGEYNWKSYHPQVLVTDMRKDNGDREPFLTQRNMHAYTLCKATREQGIVAQKQSLKRFKRSYIIARGGYVGNQHFGGMWVGDNSSTQDYLQMMLTTAINMNMSCLPIVGSDIGGFTGHNGSDVTPEPLLNRWVQAGCLLPWFRDHYGRWLENKAGKMYQELYMYPNSLDSMRKAIELRYRWQEVLYTAMYRNVTTGAPVIKALSMWNGDPNVIWHQKDQFLVGGADGFQILVAPIVHVDSDTRDVYLPAGANWVQFSVNGDAQPLGPVYEGGRTISNFWVAHDELILFVQEGAILPTRYTAECGKNKSLNTYTESDPLVFEAFGLTNASSGVLYLDDGGVTTSAEDEGNFSVVNVSATTSGASGTVSFRAEMNKFNTNAPFYLRVRDTGTVVGVTVGAGKAYQVHCADRYDFFLQGENTFWVDEATKSVWVKIPTSGLVSNATDVTLTCSGPLYEKNVIPK